MRVEAIRNKKQVRKIIDNLKKEKNYRDLLLFCIGIYTGLRVSDILGLKVRNIKRNADGKIIISKKENKTGKYKNVEFNKELQDILSDYIKGKNKEQYLIVSRNGENKPISRTQAYRIIKKITKKAKLKGNFGTHTLRKTYGFHLYKNSDVSLVQGALNHESQRDTLRYIGVEEIEINRANKILAF